MTHRLKSRVKGNFHARSGNGGKATALPTVTYAGALYISSEFHPEIALWFSNLSCSWLEFYFVLYWTDERLKVPAYRLELDRALHQPHQQGQSLCQALYPKTYDICKRRQQL